MGLDPNNTNFSETWTDDNGNYIRSIKYTSDSTTPEEFIIKITLTRKIKSKQIQNKINQAVEVENYEEAED